MSQKTPFTLYNASAGSGKTFTLVKQYLIILLQSNKPDYFKRILAITFTNKAVGEMKERILEHLMAFAKPPIDQKYLSMLNEVEKETGLSPTQISERALKATRYLLHNFSVFDVETIDKFNHRLIRTFAKDLKLPANFEIELNTDALLEQSVDKLIEKVGQNQWLTQVLLDYSFEKTDSDKDWDISKDLKKLSKVLVYENDLEYINYIKSKPIEDFLALKKNLQNNKNKALTSAKNIAQDFFETLDQNQLEKKDFTGSYLPNFFQSILNDKTDLFKGQKWQSELGEKALYPKSRVKGEKAATIDTLSNTFVSQFFNTKELVEAINFNELLLQKINGLTLLNSIYQEYISIQDEQGLVPIAEFNTKIKNEIKNQPAPYIYERLGEKYRHFFIDEFQDTSKLQWTNLEPLIENALSQEHSSLLLVGDAKQSIYRFRGGNPEQFINLYQNHDTFSNISKKVENLGTNYRSYDEIINFNNAFFTALSKTFSDPEHSRLYIEGNQQQTSNKKGGFVSLNFLKTKEAEDKELLYLEEVLKIINQLIDNNYNFRDLAILVRKNDQGSKLAQFLAQNNIPVISPEALLLKSSAEINFITDFLQMIHQFDDAQTRARVISYLHHKLNIQMPLADYSIQTIGYTKTQWEQHLSQFEINFSFKQAQAYPLYDLCERICNLFYLKENNIAYLISFLNIVNEFANNSSASLVEFLEYWEQQKNKASVVVSESLDAVQIMTIHKSKGLEFPVVIYPFADDEIINLKKLNGWISLDPTSYEGFHFLPISLTNTAINKTGDKLLALQEEKIKEDQLDALNKLYVALTRAEEQLYILTNFDETNKPNKTPSLFYDFLNEQNRWNPDALHYTFGNIPTAKKKQTTTTEKVINSHRLAYSKPLDKKVVIASNKALMWNTAAEAAIEKGTLIHLLLSKIKSATDLTDVFRMAITDGTLSKEQAQQLKPILEQVVCHPQLGNCFNENVHAYNERELFTESKKSLIPDRIIFLPNNKVTVIDYKTGAESLDHIQQIKTYATALQAMQYHIEELLLVYISDEVTVKSVSNQH